MDFESEPEHRTEDPFNLQFTNHACSVIYHMVMDWPSVLNREQYWYKNLLLEKFQMCCFYMIISLIPYK